MAGKKITDRQLPEKWQKEQAALKAIQVAFDVSDELNRRLRREALEHDNTPSDQVREILGLPVKKKRVRPRLSVTLSDQDFDSLARRFKVSPSDRQAIKQLATKILLEHLGNAPDPDN